MRIRENKHMGATEGKLEGEIVGKFKGLRPPAAGPPSRLVDSCASREVGLWLAASGLMCLLPGGGFLEAFLVLLEASWEAPQVPLGGLWALLGPSGLLQWLSWALLGSSWAALGGS